MQRCKYKFTLLGVTHDLRGQGEEKKSHCQLKPTFKKNLYTENRHHKENSDIACCCAMLTYSSLIIDSV
jgi:hypothetical protein